ncbi:MAG: L-2-amino-thiazoline-4-carboxylic acid hydrolase [Bradymonadaceae bacterium]
MIKREDIVGFRILVDELGLVDALRIGGRMQRQIFAGEPFSDLPAPESDQERESRDQIAPAIVLYRQLRDELGEERALEVAERVIREATVVFLSKTVGRLRRDELLAMDDDEREAFVREKGQHFANADLTWDQIGAESVEFTVTHCRFPPLCEAAGVPELAPLFCKGDADFFGGVEEDVDLERPHTIAEGAENCPFHIYMRDDDS